MDDVVVRRATTDDIAELAALRRVFTYENPPPGEERTDFDEAFDALIGVGLRDGSWVVWLGESSGEIVAHAFVALVHKVPRPIEASALIGYLTNVYTRPSHRGQGLGVAAYSTITSWAEESGIELLIVWPSEESTDFYRRHGFASSGEPFVWTNPTGV